MKWSLRAARRLAINSCVPFEIDDTNVAASMHENIAIGALERRAGDHGTLAGPADPVDLGRNRLQPGPAVFIGEGMAGVHLGDIAGG